MSRVRVVELRRGRACHSCGARARQRQSTVRIRSGRCGRWRAPLLEVVASAPAVAPAKWGAPTVIGGRRREAGGGGVGRSAHGAGDPAADDDADEDGKDAQQT